MKYLWPRLAVALAVAPASVRADDAPPPPPIRQLLSNPGQLATWLAERDPQVGASRAKVDAAVELHQQAGVYPNPQVSFGVGGFAIGGGNQAPGSETGPTSVGQTYDVSLGVGELVELGKRGPRTAAAELRAREAGESSVATLGGRVNDVTTTLGRLAYVAARHDVVATNLDAARKLERLEKVRLDNKDLAASEFARIQLDTEELEIQLGRADADLSIAVATCSAALYARCTAAGLDASALDAAAPLPAPGSDAGITASIADRPAHRAEQLERSALGEDATLADHRKIPDPTIGIDYTYDAYQFGGNLPQTLGVSVAIPLPLFDRGDHDAAAARANAHAVDLQAHAEMMQERGQTDGLLAQRDALATLLSKMETEAVPRSESIIVQTRKAFDLGQASLADLLLAERAHRDLLLEVLDTRFNLFNVRTQLRQSLGLDDQAARAAGAQR